MLVSDSGVLYALAPVGVAAYLLLLVVLGSEKLGVLTIMAAFVTAPMYKYLAPSVDSLVTATDVLLLLGFVVLLPTIAFRKVHLPWPYVVGLLLVFSTGCLASIISSNTLVSFVTLALWMTVMGGLVIAFALWSPQGRLVDLLAWSYVAGHMVSSVGAVVQGPANQDRYAGLATHPNYFAQAGLMAIALLLYLFWRHRTLWPRVVVVGAAAVSFGSIYFSGSRAATLVAAVLVLMIPVVERSAVIGFVMAVCGGLVILLLPILVEFTGDQSSLGRLVGNTNSKYSDQDRAQGLDAGWDRFWAAPLTGDGLIDLFRIHNMFLEAAVAIGVFGLVGYLLILFVFARALFVESPYRRLAYTTWAFIGWGATVPSLYDRSIWGPVALSVVAVTATATRLARDETDHPTPAGNAAFVPPKGRP